MINLTVQDSCLTTTCSPWLSQYQNIGEINIYVEVLGRNQTSFHRISTALPHLKCCSTDRGLIVQRRCMNTWHIYAASTSPTLNPSSNAIEICNGIMPDFYPGLLYMWQLVKVTPWHISIASQRSKHHITECLYVLCRLIRHSCMNEKQLIHPQSNKLV